ncbi:type II toxin-antitoxin system HigB family toxin [Citrobacter portucalensis]|uniref:type II toxin-antitoxin system HigB family toxin n=1 Tax=Citrobacter portucalensis TaxID=1639133 RepID=UPI001C63BE55|nr:type II toxin-antitoxin system HigB family toxin [Citrobacter portucalensis]MBW7621052.1 type II toxin-antitoxin system HigB family toxin [Citrobacter portucalensis]MBW7640163.1 type II toxin-antitoxin system HigB family toxin [Citrobacter portucalensis]MCA2134791.1 type II toxin-antitoxin system HigB family toxin [Citrobacter portucalensis]MCA2144842.1 type II toxin-antitoxin system HigB family toxin [Citrobacter portucalensis]MCA2149687.1 type II toxin-antitoxin system HigB family toxin [
MHVINRKPFNEAMLMYPNHQLALADLLNVLEKKTFIQPEEMKQYIPLLDNFKYRDKWWVIDVSGNSLRLISYIDFRSHKIFVKHIVSHAEYDKLTAYYRGNKE